MWTSRCKILHLSNIGTYEESVRHSAYTTFQSIRADSSQLSYCHRSLLRRRFDFFSRASFATVQMWIKRVQAAIAYVKHKNQQLGADIRNWVLVRPYDPGRTRRGARVPKRRRLFRFR